MTDESEFHDPMPYRVKWRDPAGDEFENVYEGVIRSHVDAQDLVLTGVDGPLLALPIRYLISATRAG